ncbi:MAG: L,D-transpeptidase family protein [Candidatus Dadabacteria bacterium]
MKHLTTIIVILVFCALKGNSQGAYTSFIDVQRTYPRPGNAILKKQDTLQKQFEDRGLRWPAKYVYIRSFKYDGQLEVWVKNERREPFKLFKSYKVCAMAGTLGPKRIQGDFQVPEGFYYINQFNPNSTYYLSLGINYPNPSDKLLSDPLHPGGDIYIHGNCVTVGCIPVTDQQIEEIYILAAHAKNLGQDFIPVHIFPVRYSNPKSAEYLSTLDKNDDKLKSFEQTLENVYDHFELTKQLPVIMSDSRGGYVFDGLSKKVQVVEKPVEKPKRVRVPHRVRTISEIPDVVTQGAQFPGGAESFFKYLAQMGNALSPFLPAGTTKANMVVEFIVDADGVPSNFKISQGVNEDFDDQVITTLEQMPPWQPAILNEKPVAKKIRQSFVIEAKH